MLTIITGQYLILRNVSSTLDSVVILSDSLERLSADLQFSQLNWKLRIVFRLRSLSNLITKDVCGCIGMRSKQIFLSQILQALIVSNDICKLSWIVK